MQPDTTPSKVQELTRDDASRLWPAAPEADQHEQTQARDTPRVTRAAGARWRGGAKQDRAVRIVTSRITLAHLHRW
jgi:hypothetical protein